MMIEASGRSRWRRARRPKSSESGSRKSRRTASKGAEALSTAESAACPVAASTTSWPLSLSVSASDHRINGSSSTTRILRGVGTFMRRWGMFPASFIGLARSGLNLSQNRCFISTHRRVSSRITPLQSGMASAPRFGRTLPITAFNGLGATHMIVLKNILVATDFSGPSEEALEYGRHLARTFGAMLHVLHVVQDVSAGYVADASYIPIDIHTQLEAAARSQLDGIVTDDDRRTVR